jgi:hypothetical protein
MRYCLTAMGRADDKVNAWTVAISKWKHAAVSARSSLDGAVAFKLI